MIAPADRYLRARFCRSATSPCRSVAMRTTSPTTSITPAAARLRGGQASRGNAAVFRRRLFGGQGKSSSTRARPVRTAAGSRPLRVPQLGPRPDRLRSHAPDGRHFKRAARCAALRLPPRHGRLPECAGLYGALRLPRASKASEARRHPRRAFLGRDAIRGSPQTRLNRALPTFTAR